MTGGRLRSCVRAEAPRDLVVRAERAISSSDPDADRCSITAEAARRLDRLKLGQIRFGAVHGGFTECGGGHGSTPIRYVTKCRSCRGGGRTPVALAARQQRPGDPRHLVGERDGGHLARLAAQQRAQPFRRALVAEPDAALITDMAPETNKARSRSLPARLMRPMRGLPPVECSFGVRPTQAAR